MTLLNTVGLSSACAMPWRNGGGVTRELLAWPQADDWLLRVSVATISHAGPFSPFPGVDRWFAVLGGAGVRLALPGGNVVATPADEPLHFDGEAAPECELIEGATTDLNLMARRDAGQAQMRRAYAGSTVEGPTRWRGLFAGGPALLVVDDVTTPVGAGTLLWTDEQGASAWSLHHHSTGPCWWLTLED